MKVWESGSGDIFCVRLDRGEEICDALCGFAREKGLTAGSIDGIGALQDLELGYFDLSLKGYRRFHLDGSHELLSLMGNLTMRDGSPFAHLHAVVADRDGEVKGGHLFSGTVSVTAEIFLRPFLVPIHRETNPEGDLALMDH